VLEGGNFSEGVARHVLRRWSSRRKDVDRDNLVVDALFFQREANGTHIDAVGRTENDRMLAALRRGSANCGHRLVDGPNGGLDLLALRADVRPRAWSLQSLYVR